MQVQIVRASTRHKVLSEARRTLGPDPLILSVRQQPKEGSAELEWEAVVARETPVAVLAKPRLQASIPKAVAELRKDLAAVRRSDDGALSTELLDLGRRLSLLESEVLSGLLEGRSLPASWLPLIECLDKAGFPKADAIRLVQVIEHRGSRGSEDSAGTPRGLRQALKTAVHVAPTHERVQPGIVIFCGGAGVGKTTMVAKLAADLCLGGMNRPCLGSVFPTKSSGVQVLKHYAKMLGLEFVEAKSSADLDELSCRSNEQPIILDTFSVNPRDRDSLMSLGDALQAVPDAEVHTVVPATHDASEFDVALTAFASVGAKRLSVTRLDEAPFIGRILAASCRARTPIAYVSKGPRIPDDLGRPSVDAILNAVLGTEMVASL